MQRMNIRRHIIHCERRAFERYDELSIKDIAPAIISKIHRGEGEFVKRQSNSKTLWRVTVNQKSYKVVYDKNTKCLVTFLPDDASKSRERAETCGEFAC